MKPLYGTTGMVIRYNGTGQATGIFISNDTVLWLHIFETDYYSYIANNWVNQNLFDKGFELVRL